MTDRTFIPRAKRIPIAAGARLDSKDIGTLFSSLVEDVNDISTFLATLNKKADNTALVDQLEATDLRSRVTQLEAELKAQKMAQATGGFLSTHALSVADSRNISFLSSSEMANRVSVDTVFGEATIPINGVEHRFYTENIRSKTLLPLANLQINVTGSFDLGDGVINYEAGATITTGSPEYAFNGNNTKQWIRKLEYDIEDDTDETITEITVTIPDQSSSQANCIYILPFPEGELDIIGVYTSPDLSNSFTAIPDFTIVEGAGPTRWFFPAQNIQRLKIRLRQRNWVEENGKRVFYVGAQEIGLRLVDFDKTYSPTGSVTDNHSFVLVAKAPDAYGFYRITGLWSDPMFTLEDAGNRHLHIKIDLAGDGTNVIWDSDSDPLPQDQVGGIAVGSATEQLYFIVTLNWVDSSGGPTGPWPVNTPPVLRGLSFQAQSIAR